MATCLPSPPSAIHFLLLLTASILTTILKFYLAFQCAWILHRGIDYASKALNTAPVPEKQDTVVQSEPDGQSDSALLDEDIDDIAVAPLEPEKSDLKSERDLCGSKGLLDGRLDELTIPTLQPDRANKTSIPTLSTSTPNTTMIINTAPWDGKINWAISGPSIFDDQQEELDAILRRPNVLSAQPTSDLWVLQYGLRYMPSAEDTNAYRTVKIELPHASSANITINDILAELRRVEVYSASLFKTAHLTASNTAIIVFIRQHDALVFLQRTAHSGLKIGSHATPARTSLVNTPTYPIPADLHRLISEHGYSRFLVVCNLRNTLKTELRRVLYKSNCRDFIECLDDGYVAGEICVRFHSVKIATTAFEMLKKHPGIGNCRFRFVKPVPAIWGS